MGRCATCPCAAHASSPASRGSSPAATTCTSESTTSTRKSACTSSRRTPTISGTVGKRVFTEEPRIRWITAHVCRSMAVHPTQPFLLTSSDDMLIKLWDWDNKWALKQTFEGEITVASDRSKSTRRLQATRTTSCRSPSIPRITTRSRRRRSTRLSRCSRVCMG